MKAIAITLLSLISLGAFAQFEKITGSGNVKKETRQVSEYSGIHSKGSMNVQVSYGAPGSIVVEADDNILPYIETVVENGTLVIRTKNKVNIRSSKSLVVYVPITNIKELKLSGSGNMNGKGAFSNGNKTEIGVSGSGNINLDFDRFSEIDVAISGSGNIKLKGKGTNNITARVSGSGNINCTEVETNNVTARISGSGDIRVNASRSIDAQVSGSGNVIYKGTASKINSRASGSGKVMKA